MSRPLLLFLSVFILLSACKKDDDVDPASFDGVINQGGDFDEVTQKEEVVSSEASTEVIDGEVWNCITTTYDALAAGGGSSGFPLFNPNASVIYPGSLIQGNSLRQATPNVIAVGRAGGTISYDLNNANLASFFEVTEVRKSSIQNAMNQIIANAPSDLPSNFTFDYSQVQSEQALALKLGIDFENAFVDVSSNFSFSSGSSLNRILVELKQSFYTMSFDIPTSDAGFFAPDVRPEDLAQFVGPGNPAAFISDVTYGRIYYMLIESTSSYSEMESAVSASFSGVVSSANVDIEAAHMSQLSGLKIKVMAFGGEAVTTLLTVGETNLSTLVTLLAESTTISTGMPISYVVRSVKTKQIVSVQLATQYDVTECVPGSASGAPPYTSHWAGNVLSAMGPVGAAFSGQFTEFYLINQAGDQYMKSNVGSLEGPFPLSGLGSGAMPFNVGAACRMSGNLSANGTILVIDETGSQYAHLNLGGEWGTQVLPVSMLGNNQNPFALNGIGAMVYKSGDLQANSNLYFFNQNGTSYTLLNNLAFGSVNPIADWSLPFQPPRCGAGIGFLLGSSSFYILFNDAGTQYAVHGNVNGTGIETIGPFDL